MPMSLFPCPLAYLPVAISTHPFITCLHIRCTFPELAVCSFPSVCSPPATCLLFWQVWFVRVEVLVVCFGKALPMEKDINGKGVIHGRESLFRTFPYGNDFTTLTLLAYQLLRRLCDDSMLGRYPYYMEIPNVLGQSIPSFKQQRITAAIQTILT